MKRYIVVFLLLAAVSTAAVLAQSSRQAVPRDDAYVSTYHPREKMTPDDVPVKDDATVASNGDES